MESLAELGKEAVVFRSVDCQCFVLRLQAVGWEVEVEEDLLCWEQ